MTQYIQQASCLPFDHYASSKAYVTIKSHLQNSESKSQTIHLIKFPHSQMSKVTFMKVNWLASNTSDEKTDYPDSLNTGGDIIKYLPKLHHPGSSRALVLASKNLVFEY
jgi:hypothetical protein